jgi:hypothetical protein
MAQAEVSGGKNKTPLRQVSFVLSILVIQAISQTRWLS